jgi:glycerophosphoryl diester phosphodiesterase
LFGPHFFEKKLLKKLHSSYGNSACAPVFNQSFEVSNLKYLNHKTNINLVQLIDADDVNADGSMSLVHPPGNLMISSSRVIHAPSRIC